MEELLPIGSIVLLNGGEKRLMIIGVLQVNPDDNEEYDYLACLYPEGFVGPEHIYLFNSEDIESVVAEGFTDDEHYEFRDSLLEVIYSVEAEGAEEAEETEDGAYT
jgi:hypothetical protein